MTELGGSRFLFRSIPSEGSISSYQQVIWGYNSEVSNLEQLGIFLRLPFFLILELFLHGHKPFFNQLQLLSHSDIRWTWAPISLKWQQKMSFVHNHSCSLLWRCFALNYYQMISSKVWTSGNDGCIAFVYSKNQAVSYEFLLQYSEHCY